MSEPRRPRPGRARVEALAILLRVEEEGAWASRLLEALQGSGLDPRDIALVHEIVLGVLRWRARLDDRLGRFSSRPLATLDPTVRETLRLGAYQLLFLDRVPDHAAVDGSVELARRAGGSGAAGFVNAVLRALARSARRAGDVDRPAVPSARSRAGRDAPAEIRPGQRPGGSGGNAGESAATAGRTGGLVAGLAADLSHPSWIVTRLLERFGEAEAIELLAANNEAPPIVIHANPLRTDRMRLRERLSAEGVETALGRFAPWSLVVLGGNPVRTRAFAEGQFWVQDEASQIVPLLFPPASGGITADLCAAPGGKAFVLATHAWMIDDGGGKRARDRGAKAGQESARAQPRGLPAGVAALEKGEPDGRGADAGDDGIGSRVVAFDLHVHRLARLARAAARVAPGLVAPIAADLTRSAPVPDGLFERVLVDAPCSGTGVLRRHPEIRWRRRFEDLAGLARLQSQLLDRAARLVRPGGQIVYSVCSIEPEEGEEVVDAFIERTGCLPLDPRPHLPEMARPLVGADQRLRAFPHRHGTDGFFAALVQKPGAIG